MPTYPFDTQLVVDPFDTSNVVSNGQVFIYATSDVNNASPLALTDPNGLPIGNPLMSNSNGFLPAFVTTQPQVKWSSAGFVGYFNSFEGMLEEVRAALAAAQELMLSTVIPIGGDPGQFLTKASTSNGDTSWTYPFVTIGPEDEWPTGLPEGTLVIRTET